MLRSYTVRSILIACLFAVSTRPALAQSTFATLTGTVTDSSGAVLPGVTITVTNIGTERARSVVTDDVGNYLVPNLDAGGYRIVAALSGFAEQTRQTELLARQTVRVDLQLHVAGTREQIDVVGTAPVIETERATIDNSKSGDDINRLALNFRATTSTSPIVVATLAPGVQQDTAGRISLAGNLPYMTSFSVDGVSVQNTRGGGPSRDLLPSVESIEEFKVTAAGNNAEYMQATDVTTTTKTGTNKLRGSAFWFNQNSRFSSIDRFAQTKPKVNANTAGVTAGGPIVHNRTFFFATYEGVRRPFETTRSQIVPPDAFRQGDLSSVQRQLVNPFTGAPYPNNQVPVNPIAAKVIDRLFPRQNQATGAALNRPNLIYNASRDFTVDGVDARVDHALSGTQRLIGRFTVKNREESGAATNPKIGDQSNRNELRQVVGIANSILGTGLLNEARGGISRQVDTFDYDFAGDAPAFMRDLGFTGLPDLSGVGGTPSFEFVGEDYIATTAGKPSLVLSNVVQFNDALTWVKGRHTLKGGFDFQYIEYKDIVSFFDGDDFGGYVFRGDYTGNPWSDFLTGVPFSTRYAYGPVPTNPYTNWWAFYLQDSWRPTAKLTVDYGLRYDLRPPMKDRSNQLGNFDRNTGSVVVPNAEALALVPAAVRASLPHTPFVLAKDAGVPEALRETDKNNVNPRLGVAWRPFGDNRTVVRGGIGTYTVPLYGSINYSLVATVTSDVPVFFNQRTPGGYAITFPNVFPAALRSVPGLGSQDFRRANQFDLRDPRTTQWSLTVERDLGGNTGVRVSYIGNRTNDIIVSPDLNQIRPNTQGYAALINTRPFQDWNVVASRDNGAHSRYDGLQSELTRRLSKGLTVDASYTYARQLSDAAGAVPGDFPTENGPSLLNTFRGPDDDYGPMPFTRRHRFVGTFLYQLPFGRGRTFGGGMGRGLDVLAGGWDLAGVALLQSGPFLTPSFSAGDPSGTGANVRGFTSTTRPDQTGDGNLADPTVDRFFDRNAFVIPANNIGRFGNAPVGSLIGPKTKVFSMTVGKSVSLAGTSRIRFEAAFSNLFNTENFGLPNRTVQSAQFGRITSTQTVDQAAPRTVQFSLRYSF
jgi:Carboxypeptidase regulatory-like domain/TonB dependent receptor